MTLVSSPDSRAAGIQIDVDQRATAPVSPLLYGKFTEHLGRNVYHGAWAQILTNSGFERARFFDRGGRDAAARRLGWTERRLGVEGLQESFRRGVAFGWATWGQGEVAASLDDAGVNGTAQRLEVADLGGDFVALRQPVYLPVHRVRTFQMSAWVKGDVGALYAGFQDRTDQVRAAVPLGEVTQRWQQMTATIELPADWPPAGEPCWFGLGVTEPGRLWVDQCFLFPADHQEGFDPDVVRMTRESRLTLLRFPGGNFVSSYHWKDGIGPIDKRPMRFNRDWNRDEPNHVGTDEWVAFCRLVGCEPMICVNAGSGTPEEAADWVEYCNGSTDTRYGALRARGGHPEPYGVRYWEIGNELYGRWQTGHCTADEYARRYRRFVDAMRTRDPHIRFIANGHSAGWNQTVVNGNQDILRSLSVHTLVGHSIPAETDADAVFKGLMAYAAVYDRHLAALSKPMVDAGLKPRLAITELQVFTNKPQLPNNGGIAEALFWAGIVDTAIRTGGLVELITHSALINHAGGLRKQNEVVFATPVYWARRMYATQPARWPVETRVDCPTFSTPRLRDLPAARDIPVLDVMALTTDDGDSLVILVTNRSPDQSVECDVALRGFHNSSQVSITTLAADSVLAANRIDATEQVQPVEATATANENTLRWTFPPISLTRLVFRRQ